MGNIRVEALLFSHPRSCEYPWREYDAEALLQRATASHVVLFTELVPSPLTSPIHSITTKLTILPPLLYRYNHHRLSLPHRYHDHHHHHHHRQRAVVRPQQRDAHSNVIEITISLGDGTRDGNGAERDGERSSEDSTESVESPWNFEREDARADDTRCSWNNYLHSSYNSIFFDPHYIRRESRKGLVETPLCRRGTTACRRRRES